LLLLWIASPTAVTLRAQEGASENIGDRLEQYGLEQVIEASQADENTHEQPTSVEI
jgi:hypothetical protein